MCGAASHFLKKKDARWELVTFLFNSFDGSLHGVFFKLRSRRGPLKTSKAGNVAT